MQQIYIGKYTHTSYTPIFIRDHTHILRQLAHTHATGHCAGGLRGSGGATWMTVMRVLLLASFINALLQHPLTKSQQIYLPFE